MLSEDEKQAIEKLKKIREDTIKANECGLSNNDFKEEIEVYNTVLNLITKLQKENEEKDKQIDLMVKFINNQNIIMIENEITCIRNIYEIVGFDKKEEDIKQYFETKAKKGE